MRLVSHACPNADSMRILAERQLPVQCEVEAKVEDEGSVLLPAEVDRKFKRKDAY